MVDLDIMGEKMTRGRYGQPLLLSDEAFLVYVYPTHYVVWCFDQHITIPNEVKEYREQLRERRERRTNQAQANGVGKR